MSYTGLVHWHAGVQGAPAQPTVRRLDRVPMPVVARPQAPSGAPGGSGDGGAAPGYAGLVGWYAAVLTAAARRETAHVAPSVALPARPHAA